MPASRKRRLPSFIPLRASQPHSRHLPPIVFLCRIFEAAFGLTRGSSRRSVPKMKIPRAAPVSAMDVDAGGSLPSARDRRDAALRGSGGLW